MEGADFGRPFEPGVNDFREFGGLLENSAGWRVKSRFLLFCFVPPQIRVEVMRIGSLL